MSFIDNISARDIAAFKAGSWATVPADYAFRNYAWPYAKKNFSEKGFYNRINRFGRDPRVRRRLTSAIVSKGSMKGYRRRYNNDLYRATKRAKYANKANAAGSAELKTAYVNGTFANGNQSVGALTTQVLYDINQGTANGDRLGSKIYAKSISVRGFCRNLNTSQVVMARLLILQDNKPQFGTLDTNLFVPQTNTNLPVNYDTGGDLTQITNPINHNRFRILSDRKYKLAPRVTASEGVELQMIDYSVKVDRHIEYLTDTVLTLANKIKPIFYAVFFVELANGAAGASMVNRDIEFYMHFNG